MTMPGDDRLGAAATPRPLHDALPRANVLGVGVHAVDLHRAAEVVLAAAKARRPGYVCVTGVHGVMEAQRDPAFRRILNRSLLTVPDGMPTVWVGRLQRLRCMARVFGPELMTEVCQRSVRPGHTHFLYGGGEGVASDLERRLVRRFPGIRVVGTFTPPFRALDPEELRRLQELVARTRPDFFWVGLSTPKQERFMAEHTEKLASTVMLGVGAAFDYQTGRLRDAPGWMKQSGLQWLHRLSQDPKRLWRRYARNNPEFLARLALQQLRRRRPLDD